MRHGSTAIGCALLIVIALTACMASPTPQPAPARPPAPLPSGATALTLPTAAPEAVIPVQWACPGNTVVHAQVVRQGVAVIFVSQDTGQTIDLVWRVASQPGCGMTRPRWWLRTARSSSTRARSSPASSAACRTSARSTEWAIPRRSRRTVSATPWCAETRGKHYAAFHGGSVGTRRDTLCVAIRAAWPPPRGFAGGDCCGQAGPDWGAAAGAAWPKWSWGARIGQEEGLAGPPAGLAWP